MTTRRLGVSAAVVDGTVVAGDLTIDDGVVGAVGVSPPGRSGVAVPGFVDLQANGWGGIDLRTADPAGVAQVAGELARRGTTAWLPTVPTASIEATRSAVAAVAAAQRAQRAHDGSARILGIHLEGPFLSPERRGAHPLGRLRPVETSLVDDLRRRGPVRLVTVAPELPGAIDLIRHLTAAGVVTSVGHTTATAAQAHAAFDAGARAHTHVWNAHRPPTAREPGSGPVAMTRSDVSPMVIADLAHVGPETLLVVVRSAPDRFIVVSDASAAAGLPAGVHRIGGAEVVVGPDAARLPDGTLTGAVTGLDGAVSNLTALGLPLPEAIAAAAERPARLVDARGHGGLSTGSPANVAVLDDEHRVTTTFVHGRPVEASAPR